MKRSPIMGVMLYIGPDVFLPLTSAIAAIAGVALMFWQRIVGFARKAWYRVSGRGPHNTPQ